MACISLTCFSIVYPKNSGMKRITIIVCMFSLLGAARAQWVATVAGVVETPGFNDGPALGARFFQPHGIAADSQGRVFIADRNNHTIRLFDTKTGMVSTLAGTPGQIGSNDGIGSNARFNEPWGVCATPDGVVYVADTRNNKIRKVTPDGTVTTVAGTGNYGTSNGNALAATFGNPTGIEIDAVGNIYVADHLTHIIRKISPNGTVSTLAGTAYIPGDVDGNGTGAQFWRPYGLSLDNDGNILVADEWNHKIRKITPQGTVTTLAGTGMEGYEDGLAANASFNLPWDITTDPDGNVYVADGYNYVIRKIGTDGNVSTIAGTVGITGGQNGQGINASFNGATGITRSQESASLFVADAYNHLIREITFEAPSDPTLSLLNLNGVGVLCQGDLLQVSAQPNTFGSYRFYIDGTMVQDNGSSDLATSQLMPGQHTITVESDYQGQLLTADALSFTVVETPMPTIAAVGPLSFYEGDSVQLFASGTGSFLWSNAETTQAITVKESGNYFVEATQNGCTGISETVVVTVTPLPNALSVSLQGGNLLCPGGKLILNASTAENLQWLKDGWPLAGQVSQALEVTEPGVYQVKATAQNTGIVTLSNEVEILNAPVPNIDFIASPRLATPGQPITFGSAGPDQPVSFLWEFGDPASGASNSSGLSNPTHTYSTEGAYSIKLLATDVNGCQHLIERPNYVQVSNASQGIIFIPNAFTPNGDGENDVLRVRGVSEGAFSMVVFNQWGEMLFQSSSIASGWDGNREGRPVAPGNYTYVVKLQVEGKEKEMAGMVTLLR